MIQLFALTPETGVSPIQKVKYRANLYNLPGISSFCLLNRFFQSPGWPPL